MAISVNNLSRRLQLESPPRLIRPSCPGSNKWDWQPKAARLEAHCQRLRKENPVLVSDLLCGMNPLSMHWCWSQILGALHSFYLVLCGKSTCMDWPTYRRTPENCVFGQFTSLDREFAKRHRKLVVVCQKTSHSLFYSTFGASLIICRNTPFVVFNLRLFTNVIVVGVEHDELLLTTPPSILAKAYAQHLPSPACVWRAGQSLSSIVAAMPLRGKLCHTHTHEWMSHGGAFPFPCLLEPQPLLWD